MITTSLRPPDSIRAPSLDQRALELGEAAEHGQHELAVRCRRVGPRVAERLEGGAGLGDRVQRVQEVFGRPCEPIQARDDKGVALTEGCDRTRQRLPLRHRAADLLGDRPWSIRPRSRLLVGFRAIALRSSLARIRFWPLESLRFAPIFCTEYRTRIKVKCFVRKVNLSHMPSTETQPDVQRQKLIRRAGRGDSRGTTVFASCARGGNPDESNHQK